MKTTAKRAFSLMMALALSISILIGVKIPAQAASVDYVYSGKYIYNWGTRGTDATFLSPNAIKFYGDNNTSYLQLASLSGSSSESGVPSSALYKKLQTIMSSNQTYQTSYDATKSLYKYTDCQGSGKINNGEISSFYSGTLIGPNWGGSPSWNREHTWPNSKGNKSGNGENDIMMLRPTASSENTSRGNKAYGQTSGYYNPNNESNGKYDLRGDVARIILYTYVRWNCTNTGSNYNPNGIFGLQGVIESKKVMLDWIEDDPVDTWELGRNDAVESVTGTRNVFVDYPELAFLLFGEAIPANYQSPSKSTQTSKYEIEAKSGNSKYGKVAVNGSMITATPSNGYEVSDYKITKGTATVTQSGNSFIVNASSDVSITINFVKATCKHSNTIDIPGSDATCEVVGYTDGVYCTDCQKYISGHAEIATKAHTYTDSKDTTCNVCGYVKNSTVTSKPSSNTTSKPTANNTSSNSQINSQITNDVTSNDQLENETVSSLPDGNIDNTPEGIPNITPDGIPNIITDNGKKSSFPWWIVIVAVVVLGGGAVAVVFITKKYKKL